MCEADASNASQRIPAAIAAANACSSLCRRTMQCVMVLLHLLKHTGEEACKVFEHGVLDDVALARSMQQDQSDACSTPQPNDAAALEDRLLSYCHHILQCTTSMSSSRDAPGRKSAK
jgi:hypothetical protein